MQLLWEAIFLYVTMLYCHQLPQPMPTYKQESIRLLTRL